MASYTLSLQVLSFQKTPSSPKFDDIKTSLSSVLTPFVKGFEQGSIRVDASRTVQEISKRALEYFVNSVFQFIDQPYLPSQSNFAPVEELRNAVKIKEIDGEIPTDFPVGVYLRNGPNPLFGGLKSTVSVFGTSSSIWIEGEGMLHAMYFTKNGEGSWDVTYNNRYVETETFLKEKREGKPIFLPSVEGDSVAVIVSYVLNLVRFGIPYKYSSNTSIFEHAGKLYTATESHMPHEIDKVTLNTVAKEWDVENCWGRPFTSHPKKAPGSGELVTVGASATKPFLVLGIISADGTKLLHKVDLKLNRSIICHEIGVTQEYNIIIDNPLIVDLERLVKGGPLIKLDKKTYSKIGVMPRYGDANSIRWFEVAPNCTFHIINCFEDGNEVVVRGCRARGSIIPGPDFGHDKVAWFAEGFNPTDSLEIGELFSSPYEWRLNMGNGEVKERYLTGNSISMDFPMINENYTGIRNSYGYTQVVDLIASSESGMAKYGMLGKLYFDEATIEEKVMEKSERKELIKVEYHKFEEHTFCSGATFVAKSGCKDEDDGWVICFTHNEETDISQVLIVDSKNFEGEPVAKITLPQRVPYGFHGTYFSTPCGNDL